MNTSTRLSLAAVTALLVACGGSDDSVPAPSFTGFTGGAVTLQFEARAGSVPVRCGTAIANLGTTRAGAKLQDLRFHVANVSFIKSDGGEVPLTLARPPGDDLWNARSGADSLTLIDLEDGTAECANGGTTATNAVVSGSVPAGNYVAVKMTIGVPESLNHLDPFATDTPIALTSTALGWSWTTGRIFSKIEVTDPSLATAPSWPAPVFTSHLGALNCTGDPAAGTAASCAIPNRMQFTLGDSGTNFDPTKQKIVLDLQGLLAGNDVTTNTAGTASGCMSALDDPECAGMFDAMKINRVTGLPISGGLGQTVFKVADK